jgi:ectoine hydroxylase-related dioxygenase (phytanoyl-CoA dioxygenase family)
MTTTLERVSVRDIEMDADHFDLARAANIYQEHGCLVVRGLMKPYVAAIKRDILETVRSAEAMLDRARKTPEGWLTPDGTLWIPAPKHFARDKQVMVVACSYRTSAAFFRSAFEPRTVDLASAILGDDLELFADGQVLVKEPVGGHPKMLHQDAAYFEHRLEGPVAMLNYAVDCDENNGCLWVIPGTHRLGVLPHIDTESHLGLPLEQWPWERAVPVHGKAGDAIFFHVKTVHGSKPNWSKEPRPVFIHRYRRADDYVIISATTAANRAEAEKRVLEMKKENQRGFMVKGSRLWDERHTA